MNVEGDRLSNLPDDLIHKILSYVDIKQAIETSGLSSTWRYIWTTMPSLNFSEPDFHTSTEFSNFVTRVLSNRNDETEVSSVKLVFRGKISQVFVKRILDYAFSHNVQQLDITCLDGMKKEFPFSLFNSESLKHLTLNGSSCECCIMNPSIWDLPALETLSLYNVSLYDDTTVGLFSKCTNLNKLILYNCKLVGKNGVNICHPRLSSLYMNTIFCKSVNVVTPQLKNLTIKYWVGKLLISAPNLFSFRYKTKHYRPLDLSADFLQLEKVDICIRGLFKNKENAHKIVSLLQQLHSAKYVTLNFEIIKLLSLFLELISNQPSPFTNLKTLKIYPAYVRPEKEESKSDEIRADRIVASVRKLMKDLQVELDRLKEKIETHMDQGKASVEVENNNAQLDMEVKGHFGEKMTRVASLWEDLNEQLEKWYNDVGYVISMLRGIEEVLAKLPVSHRGKLQARFSRLCAEAGAIMDNIMDHSKS